MERTQNFLQKPVNGACLGSWSLQAIQVLHPALVKETRVTSLQIAYWENLHQNNLSSVF